MKIFVQAKPSAREEKIEKMDESHYTVSVKEPPIKGLANEAIIKAVAGFFNVPRASVRIVSGYTSRQKVIEIIKS
ncbi:hypothetical protein A2316_03535 [Candidatus Falkowbacteria bacterium RIFOXYB2_FULL_38_15]|uniref:UPF0235 protein A2257_03795 n=1 Tax=Candidatus Falkowbacteria bacterium RIFOXYA2_FULL_38_12 TaxID=1797993 RepID=A0A1F5S1A3_9BACT|nr:MAG: hypothetical protein A2257_03795 [Candidatus Falkowbacteria bacterium RIFOXYA2_FULL_38_12]OGF33552.1 MAG: hypothetical protein A2316_03535 [Candidatus Falkowbacteria bacterium RIFOXYB2_FULL_38_15]OGF44158.1 MAG: hypothetical protein A2555_02100 [Candidatus Falkowbacteria bacterium RIFOXYD2_FULL_39_16]